MTFKKKVTLATHTTFHIGGPADFFIEAHTKEDVLTALAFSREQNLPIFPLGGGSNLLVPDAGVRGIVLKCMMDTITFKSAGEDVLLSAGSGTRWESVVNSATSRNLFGIENLAGIPGTIGGATVQNIGAYGAEFSKTFEYAEVIDSTTGLDMRVSHKEAQYGYRTSIFKQKQNLIVIKVVLRLSANGMPHTTYADFAEEEKSGVLLQTPSEIATAVRTIRARKFSKSKTEGTAGSFFKNPTITKKVADELVKKYPELPQFPQPNGLVKVSLAWILDKVLALKGFEKNGVRLYENHPLIVVAKQGATAANVDTLAQEVAARVHTATGIVLEREVETFNARK